MENLDGFGLIWTDFGVKTWMYKRKDALLMCLHDQDEIALVLDLRNQKIALRSNKHLSVARFYERIAANPDQAQLMCQLNITDIH